MASITLNIRSQITRGNDVDLKVTLTTAVPLTRARWMVKANISDPDSSAIINKQITSTSTADGQILTAGGGSTTALLLFKVSKTETMLFTAYVDYPYDIEVYDATNKASTPVGGMLNLNERVRTASG